MNKIVFFSSDQRGLYKSDIYKSLCLPKDYVIQFRYQKKYIHSNVTPASTVGKSGVIFFTVTEQVNATTTVKENISIREVVIVDVEDKKDTGLVHFFLKLGEFKQYTISPSNAPNRLPLTAFVSDLELDNGSKHDWHERIDEVKSQFIDELFVKIDLLNKSDNKVIPPKYQSKEKQSLYMLKDQNEYLLDIAFYNTSNVGKTQMLENVLKIQEKSDHLHINCEEFIQLGALRDNRKYRFVTKNIDNSEVESFLRFDVLKDKKDANSITQSFALVSRITKNSTRQLLFGLYSSLLALGTSLFIVFGATLKDKCPNYYFLIGGLLLVGLSTSQLYKFFNKK